MNLSLQKSFRRNSTSERNDLSSYIVALEHLTAHEPICTIKLSVDGFLRDQDLLWCSALTYTSGLSIVPILAVALAALNGFGETAQIRPLIQRYVAVNSPEITRWLLGFVQNASSKALGTVGGASLLVTVLMTLGTVEQAFNNIFKAVRGRSWLRKFSDYLSVVFTVPLLMAAAVAVEGRFLGAMPRVPEIAVFASVLITWAGIFFLYVFFPYTRVDWRSAAAGSLAASILMQLAQWGFVYFQTQLSSYRAIYGALAAVPLVLTWLYLNWIIVLYGAELTAAIDGTSSGRDVDEHSLGFVRRSAALIICRIGERMLGQRNRPVTAHIIAREIGVCETAIDTVIERLKASGIVVESAQGDGLFLSRDSSTLTMAQVMSAVESREAAGVDEDARVRALIERLHDAEFQSIGPLTVYEFVKMTGQPW
jgi:membrane protein